MSYNPGVYDRSGEIFGNAVTQSFATLGNAIGDRKKRIKEELEKTKKSRAILKALGRDDADLLSGAEAVAEVEGEMFKQSKKAQDIMNQNRELQSAVTQLSMDKMRKELEGGEAFNRTLASATGGPGGLPQGVPTGIMQMLGGLAPGAGVMQPGPGGLPPGGRPPAGPPVAIQDLIGMAAKSGLATPEMVAKMMGDAAVDMPVDTNTFQDPVTGTRFVRHGKQILPSGVDPAAQKAPELVPQEDENGELIGYSQHDGKKWVFRSVKDKSVKPFVDPETKKTVARVYVDGSGKVVDLRSDVEKATGMVMDGGKEKAPEKTAGKVRRYVPGKGLVD
jgi:hypothetical protein